jgi:serine/threonine-protein kinase
MTQRPIIPRWLFALVTVLLIGGLAVGVPLGIRYLNEKDKKSEEAEQEAEATAPTALSDVRGKPYADALQELTAAGFKVVKAPDTVPGGTAEQVAAQSPAPEDVPGGMRAKESTVTLKVFAGVGDQVIPYLRGATEADARKALGDRGFTNVEVAPTRETDQMVPKGSVLKTNPDASPARQKLDTPIQLILSDGPPPVQVPAVEGKSIQDARNLLIAAGFVVSPNTGEEPTPDPTKIGTVLRVLMGGQPVPATALFGSTLDLVLGIDTATAPVPELTGMTVDQATALLTAAKLQVGTITTESSDTVPAGQVLSFTPAVGQEIPKGSGVDLLVSSGPAVVLGDFTGQSVANADALVRSAGLIPAFESGCSSSPTVVTQNPAPGTIVQAGTTVDMYCFFVIGPFIPLTPVEFQQVSGG